MSEVRKKILIVDDEKIIRDFFKRLLLLFGVDAYEAADGYQAIELVKPGPFDIVFIDVRMPGISGLETYREIRKIRPDVKAVMMTGYAVEDQLNQAKSEGALGVIRKPFDINEIKEVIESIGTPAAVKPLNILVIDDDDIVLNFFIRLLTAYNHRYQVAHGKQEALEKVSQDKFDLIFLDIVLKDCSGQEVYDAIKEKAQDASVVLMTGHPEKAQEAGQTMKVAGCLFKPFEVDNILQIILSTKTK